MRYFYLLKKAKLIQLKKLKNLKKLQKFLNKKKQNFSIKKTSKKFKKRSLDAECRYSAVRLSVLRPNSSKKHRRRMSQITAALVADPTMALCSDLMGCVDFRRLASHLLDLNEKIS